MTNANRVVVSGATLILSPELAKAVGKSAALVLQQVHYWLSMENKQLGCIENGIQWIRNSYRQWQSQLSHLSLSTIRRAFYSLESAGIIQSKRFEAGKHYQGGEQVKYFTINYDVLEHVLRNTDQILIQRPGVSQKDEKNVIEDGQKGIKKPSNQPKMSGSVVQNEQAYISESSSEIKSFFSYEPQRSKKTKNAVDLVLEEETFNLNPLILNMLQIWNNLMEDPKNPLDMTSKLHLQLEKTLHQCFDANLKQWETFCLKIASSKFLMGEITPFKAKLHWVLKPDIVQKIHHHYYTFGDRVVKQNIDIQMSDDMPEKEKNLREKIIQTIGKDLYIAYFQDVNSLIVDPSSPQSNQDLKPYLVVQSSFLKNRFKQDFKLGQLVTDFFEDVLLEGEPLPNTSDHPQPLVDDPILSFEEQQVRDKIRQETGEKMYDLVFKRSQIHTQNRGERDEILFILAVENRAMKDYVQQSSFLKPIVLKFFNDLIIKGDPIPSLDQTDEQKQDNRTNRIDVSPEEFKILQVAKDLKKQDLVKQDFEILLDKNLCLKRCQEQEDPNAKEDGQTQNPMNNLVNNPVNCDVIYKDATPKTPPKIKTGFWKRTQERPQKRDQEKLFIHQTPIPPSMRHRDSSLNKNPQQSVSTFMKPVFQRAGPPPVFQDKTMMDLPCLDPF